MTLGSPKGFSSGMISFPRSITSILILLGGLAFFLFCASWLLILDPIGLTIHGHLIGIDRARKSGLVSLNHNQTINLFHPHKPLKNGSHDVIGQRFSSGSDKKLDAQPTPSSVTPNGTGAMEISRPFDSPGVDSKVYDYTLSSLNSTTLTTHLPETLSNNSREVNSGSCDLYHGKWFYDPLGPLYTNNTCPVLTQMQNCQGNGRPDKDYENWRWKPYQCDLP